MRCGIVLFSILALKHLSNVPAREIFVRIIGLPLREVELLTVEPHKPFLKARRTVGIIGYQYL